MRTPESFKYPGLKVEQGRATCGNMIYKARQQAFPFWFYITAGIDENDPSRRWIVAQVEAPDEQRALEKWAATAEVGA